MNEKHHDSLKMYVNDVIGLERDILNAIEGQLKDDRVTANPRLTPLLQSVVTGSKSRLQRLKEISEAEGGSFGAGIKEAVTSASGALAGIYGKLREHPVSRMLRDDIIALDVASTSYTMLFTLARGVGHSTVADLAHSGMDAVAPQILALTDLLPGVVLGELADEAPLSDPTAEQVVLTAIREAWSQDAHVS